MGTLKDLKEITKRLKNLKQELREKYKVKEMGVFGSFVRNEQAKTSDVDILVEFKEVPDLLKFIELERYLEKSLKVKVDLVRKSALRKEIENRVLKEVVRV